MKTFFTSVVVSVIISSGVLVVNLTQYKKKHELHGYSLGICMINGGVPVGNVCLENAVINNDWYDVVSKIK